MRIEQLNDIRTSQPRMPQHAQRRWHHLILKAQPPGYAIGEIVAAPQHFPAGDRIDINVVEDL